MIHAESPPGATEWIPSAIDKASLILSLRGTWVFAHEPDIPAMQKSLSQTLDYYPHLCGRMRGGKTVALNNDGVPFTTQTMSHIQVAEAVATPSLADQFSVPLKAGPVKRGRIAPMSVTITRLSDGFALGIRASHAFLDGTAFYALVDTWSRIHRGADFDKPVLDQSLFPEPTGRRKSAAIDDADDFNWYSLGPGAVFIALTHMMRGTFAHHCRVGSFNDAELTLARDSLRTHTSLQISRHELISAHILRLWGTLFDIPEGTELRYVSVMNARERLKNIPATFVGNAAWNPVVATVHTGESLQQIAKTIHRGMMRYQERPSERLHRELQLTMDLAHHKVTRLPYDFWETLQRAPTLVYVNSFQNAPIYSPDFGGGIPAAVIPHNLPDPVFIWPRPPATGGVDIYFNAVAARQYRRIDKDHPFITKLPELMPPNG